MTRSRRTPRVAALAATLAAALAMTTGTAHAQEGQTRVELDPRAEQRLQKPVPVADVFPHLRVRSDARGPVSLVLFLYRVRDGRVVARARSQPFTAQPGVPIYGREIPLDGGRFFTGNSRVGPEGLISARKAVPAEEGVTEPVPFIVNGIFSGKPDGWRERDVVYVIAAPADGRARAGWSVYPIGLFLAPVPMGDP